MEAQWHPEINMVNRKKKVELFPYLLQKLAKIFRFLGEIRKHTHQQFPTFSCLDPTIFHIFFSKGSLFQGAFCMFITHVKKK